MVRSCDKLDSNQTKHSPGALDPAGTFWKRVWKCNESHHRANLCSTSLRKPVWNLCRGSKVGKTVFFRESGVASSCPTACWKDWDQKYRHESKSWCGLIWFFQKNITETIILKSIIYYHIHNINSKLKSSTSRCMMSPVSLKSQCKGGFFLNFIHTFIHWLLNGVK